MSGEFQSTDCGVVPGQMAIDLETGDYSIAGQLLANTLDAITEATGDKAEVNLAYEAHEATDELAEYFISLQQGLYNMRREILDHIVQRDMLDFDLDDDGFVPISATNAEVSLLTHIDTLGNAIDRALKDISRGASRLQEITESIEQALRYLEDVAVLAGRQVSDQTY